MMRLKSTSFSTLGILNIDQEVIFRTEPILVNTLENVFILPRMQPSWISVDFDNWRDWENEEDEGKAEYDRYVDVSISVWDLLIRSLMCPATLQYLFWQYSYNF